MNDISDSDNELDQNKANLTKQVEDHLMEKYQTKHERLAHHFSLEDPLIVFREGMEAIVHDNFTECFSSMTPERWNHTLFLFCSWCLGVLFRYVILLPLRLVFFFGGIFIFIIVALLGMLIKSERLILKSIQLFGSSWLYSIGGVVKYHGHPPKRRKNQIYVSNHTSLIDFIVLSHYQLFSTVGQKHGGFVGFMQTKVVAPLKNIFFERFEFHDRTSVPKRIANHIGNLKNPPLLIFPEGVCVNNTSVLQFKKGVFEMDNVEICPIAMRYNKLFSDPYWSSREESFISHMFRLMTSWCTVCDVYWLEPQKIKKTENPIQFAGRVQALIAKKSGLKNLAWNGYLKYFRNKEKDMKARQKVIADRLRKNLIYRAVHAHKKSFKIQSEDDPSSSEGEEIREPKKQR